MFQGSKHVARGQALRAPARSGRRRRRQRHDRRSTARTTTRPSRRTSSSSRCGSRATAWATCSTRSTQKTLANQHDVVRNERRAELREPAVRHGRRSDLYAALYPPGHPYYAPTSSARTRTSRRRRSTTSATSSSATTRPNNATLVDRRATSILRDARRSSQKYFGSIPARAGRAEAVGGHAADRRPSAASRSPTGSSCRGSTSRG